MRLHFVTSVMAGFILIGAGVAAADTAPFVRINGNTYDTWDAFRASPDYRGRCATPGPDWFRADALPPTDCSFFLTNPAAEYAPLVNVYEIPVWVHILHHTDGTGNISDGQVESQIQILNEDFMAMPGSMGENGNAALVRFRLEGITRTANNIWHADNDETGYTNALAVDPAQNLNIYVNLADGALGYVPFFPQQEAGTTRDRVVIFYRAFGTPSDLPPYDLGRTATHEVGHYLGLFHTFQDDCGTETSPDCYSTGDRICDTAGQMGQLFGCPSSSVTCTNEAPKQNYMNYTDDLCMTEFSMEQVHRMRCTIQHYRPALAPPTPTVTSGWSSVKARFASKP